MPKIIITESQLNVLLNEQSSEHLKSKGFVGIDKSKGEGAFGMYHYAALATAKMLMDNYLGNGSYTTPGRNYCYRVGMFGSSGQIKYKIDNYGNYGEMRSRFEGLIPKDGREEHDVWNTFYLWDFFGAYSKLLNAGKKAFPNGAYEWFVNWFGTDDVNKIKSDMGNILKKEPPFCHGGGSNAKLSFVNPNYQAEAGISKETGHMILDIISIVALILPPPIGIGVSVAADTINTVWYAAEGDYLGAGLSALGIIPGLPSSWKSIRVSKNTEKAFETYLEAISKGSNKGKNAMSVDTMKKYYDDVTKNLTDIEKVEFDNIWKHVKKNQSKWSNITPQKVEKSLKNLESFAKNDWVTKWDKKAVKQVLKDEKWIKRLNELDGDVYKLMKEFISQESNLYSFIVNAGLYGFMYHPLGQSMMGKLIEEVGDTEVVNELILNGYGYPKMTIEKTGGNWEIAKKAFGSSGSKEDNSLLKKAWLDKSIDPDGLTGWRPGVEVPEKYWTPTYRKNIEELKKYETSREMMSKGEFDIESDKFSEEEKQLINDVIDDIYTNQFEKFDVDKNENATKEIESLFDDVPDIELELDFGGE
jgi:hypothetical protein